MLEHSKYDKHELINHRNKIKGLNNSPLRKITRDKDGLISDGSVEYVFADSGLIDWRKMLKTEHLVPNKDRTSETDVTKLKDYQLIILLGGIKELAQVRGYTNVNYDIHSPSPEYVVATCSITWIPNYETENKEVVFSAVGDASPNIHTTLLNISSAQSPRIEPLCVVFAIF